MGVRQFLVIIIGAMGVGCLQPAQPPAVNSNLPQATDGGGDRSPVEVPAGEEGGPCYGNSTCNEGLTCLSGFCVDASSLTEGNGGGSNVQDAGLDAGHGADPTGQATPADAGPVDVFPPVDVPPPSLSVVLNWDVDTNDMDLHMRRGEGEFCSQEDSCFFHNCKLTNFYGVPDWDGDWQSMAGDPVMVEDDTCGYGPEEIYIAQPVNGEYVVAVHFFGNVGCEQSTSEQSTIATLKIVVDGEIQETLWRFMPTVKDRWVAAKIQWLDGVATVTPLDDYRAGWNCFQFTESWADESDAGPAPSDAGPPPATDAGPVQASDAGLAASPSAVMDAGAGPQSP